MKIYFAVIILSLIVSSSYKTFGYEISGISLLDPVCAVEFEPTKDCSNSSDDVIGCSFSRKVTPCDSKRSATCTFETKELESDQIEFTISGERGYFHFVTNKKNIQNNQLRYSETRHQNLLFKDIAEITIQFNDDFNNVLEVKAIEYERNRLTGKIQYSDQVHCIF